MGGCSTVEGREGRSSTAATRMAWWRGDAGGRRGERGVYIGAARLWGDSSGRRRCCRGTQPRPVRRRQTDGPWRAPGRYGTHKWRRAAREDSKGPRAWARGEGAAWDGGRPWAAHDVDAKVGRREGARDVAARRRLGLICSASQKFGINFLQNLVYKCSKR
jgi:hypothetical protein